MNHRLAAALLVLLLPIAACEGDDPVPEEPSLLEVTGNNQTGIVGQPLAQPITVRLIRPGGFVAPEWTLTLRGGTGDLGLLVNGSSTSGDGSTLVVTAQGETTIQVTLGPEPGTHTAELTASGLLTEPDKVILSFTALPTQVETVPSRSP